MVHFEILDFFKTVSFKVSKDLLPLLIKFLQLLITYLDVFSKLSVLNVRPQLILVCHYVQL